MQGRKALAVAPCALCLSGCASHYDPEVVRDPYGLLMGMWHGFVFPYALVVNFVSWLLGLVGISFPDSIQLIGRPNTGLWYYVGFGLGLSVYGANGTGQ